MLVREPVTGPPGPSGTVHGGTVHERIILTL
jgi:hypothetical protein